MAMPILSVPLYPTVPLLAGVPALLRNPAAAITNTLQMVEADALGALANVLAPRWGVFDSLGNPIAVSDTTLSVEFRADSRISSYSQEEGAFASFNKVQLPDVTRVQLVCGGSAIARAAFLAAIDAAKKSTTLYSVITPDATYANSNIVGYDYQRTTRSGVTMLVVTLYIEEVRQAGPAQFANSNLQNPASSDPISMGQVQVQPPSTGQAALFGPVSVVSGSSNATNRLIGGQ